MKRYFTLFILMFALANLSAQTYTSSPSSSIPDNNCDVTNEFTQDLSGQTLANIDATFGLETAEIDISHSWVSDLDVFLIAPDGTEVELTTDNGGSGDDYTNTVFDMGAGTDITSGSAPFTGSFIPEGDLGTINNGQNPNGIWTLRACDDASGDAGTLNFWSITFGNNPAPPPSGAPANDLCAGAIALPVGTTCTNTLGTNDQATASGETPVPSCSLFGGGVDVWYSVVVPCTGDLTVEMSSAGGPTDWAMSVYSGTCGSLSEVECDDDDGTGNFPLISLTGQTPGETLLVRVWEYNSNEEGQFNICAYDGLPANDACAGAITLVDGVSQTGCTDNATNVESLTACNGGGGGGSCAAGGTGTTDFTEGVWFVYTSTAPGESIKVDTDNPGTDFDTEILVYEGSCGSLTCVGGDDDGGDGSGSNFDSEFCWQATAAGIDYYIYIDGHSGATGNFEVLLERLPPENDECATATVLAMNTPGSLIDQTFGGATNGGDGAEACDAASTPSPNDIWYRVNTDADGGTLIIIVEPGPNSDVVVAIYNNCGDPIPEQCVDLGGNGGAETINFNANFKDDKGNQISTSRDADYFIRVYEKVVSGETFEIGAQGAALPIVLGTFEANAEQRGNRVTWTTLSEINSDYVEVMSSPNGSTKWEVLGIVKTEGESTAEQKYEFFDYTPYEVTYYRLNAVDKDGRSELSQIINVRRTDAKGKVTLSPNPAREILSIQTTSNLEENANIKVVNMSGELMIDRQISLKKGLNTLSLDLADLNAGLYLFSIQTSDGMNVQKFVKQ